MFTGAHGLHMVSRKLSLDKNVPSWYSMVYMRTIYVLRKKTQEKVVLKAAMQVRHIYIAQAVHRQCMSRVKVIWLIVEGLALGAGSPTGRVLQKMSIRTRAVVFNRYMLAGYKLCR